MIPISTSFATPAPTAIAPSITATRFDALIPRGTSSSTIIRDPYLGRIGDFSTAISNYLNDLSVFNVSTIGKTTYWNAIKPSPTEEPVTTFYTDEITQFKWRLHQAWGSVPNSSFVDEIYSCNVRTQNKGTTFSQSMLECMTTVERPLNRTAVTTQIASTLQTDMPGPVTILIRDGTMTTPIDISSASCESGYRSKCW